PLSLYHTLPPSTISRLSLHDALPIHSDPSVNRNCFLSQVTIVDAASRNCLGKRGGGVKKARGRPRSKKAQQAVLQADADLYVDLGYDKTTMEGIAGRAGVSKQTVYRWWGSKAKILLEVLTSEYVRFPVPGPDATHSLRDDLVAWITQIADERHNGAATNQIINMLVSIVMAG